MRHLITTMTKSITEEYNEELFELFWLNAPEFMKLSPADRHQIMADYNEVEVMPKWWRRENEKTRSS